MRRWLARVHFKRSRVRMAQSAMTVQRYVRGWLTRKRLLQMRCEWEQRQKEERLREHRKQSIKERDGKSLLYFVWIFVCSFSDNSKMKMECHVLAFAIVFPGMQQQVQKVMAKKKVDKQQIISENRSNNVDKSTDNNEQSNLKKKNISTIRPGVT